MKKIVFSCLEYERYQKKFGKSFEYNNFLLSLQKLPDTELIFVSFQKLIETSRQEFNRELLECVKREKPDLFFAFMYTDEFDRTTLDEIRKHTKTLAWFSDDHWRFDNYSQHYARHFDWVVTTHSKAPERYRKIGQPNVIRSQWFCNSDTYVPVTVEKDVDVSFLGLKNRGRASVISSLSKKGMDIYVSGNGWQRGKLNQQEFITMFSRSKINLNINNTRALWEPYAWGRLFARRSADAFVPSFDFVNNVRSWKNMLTPQIKARPFEIGACGGFCISGWADDIETYYEPDKEMVFYKDADDLAEKIQYYLAHDDERKNIARAGYDRTLRDHTYTRRFEQIFKAIGL
jgi:spore maturation protein CgeB